MNVTRLEFDTETPSFPGPLTLADGGVELFRMPLREFAIYRLDFEATCAGTGYWYADFYNAAGERNYADNHSSVYPSTEGFAPHTSLFMARAEAVTGILGFRVQADEVRVRKVAVRPIDKADALNWMDALYARLPPVQPQLDADRWQRLPKTRRTLAAGGHLRLVALGDSISNDLVNGLGHLLVERRHPGCVLLPIHANGPEQSTRNYQADEVLQRLVVRHRPDLFMIAGMSHDPESARTTIRKVRQACAGVEAVCFDIRVDGDPHPDARRRQLDILRQMGDEDGFAVWDMTTAFQDCVHRADQPLTWFQRDVSHVNDRGKQILARLFEAYFHTGGAA